MQDLLRHFGVTVDPSHAILVLALLLSRTVPIALIVPFLGGDLIPPTVKMGIGVALAVVLFPAVADTPIQPAPVMVILLLVKEVFIGTTLAIAASYAFDAARGAGTFVDTVSGANMATVFVPQIEVQASLFADLNFQMSIVLFLAMNGHHFIINSLADSIRAVPLNDFPHFGHGMWPFANALMRMTGDMLLVSFTLAAPAAVAVFMTDVAMGLINRVAPQIQVFFISMSIKPVVAVTMVLLALTVIVDRLGQVFASMTHWTQEMVRWMG
jgi:flagellar biosynthesis protein FliR